MGTRCGDVDAGALSFIMDKEGMDGAGLSDLINKRSGVAGGYGSHIFAKLWLSTDC